MILKVEEINTETEISRKQLTKTEVNQKWRINPAITQLCSNIFIRLQRSPAST